MRIRTPSSCCNGLLFVCVVLALVSTNEVSGVGQLVKREHRRQIVSTDYGAISAVDIKLPINQMQQSRHQLQFISLDPNSIFLPALLHADMLLYVHTGSGTLSYTEGKEMESRKLTKGDVYRLKSNSVFYIESQERSESDEQVLKLIAVFSDSTHEQWVGPYSGIRDLFQGFETRLLQAAFQAPEEVMEEIVKAAELPPIVQGSSSSNQKTTTTAPLWKRETLLLKTLMLDINGVENDLQGNKKKKKHKEDEEESTSFNLFKAKREVDNCDGWIAMVNPKDLHDNSQEKEEDSLGIRAFMLSLRPGAMAGPHWHPSSTEIAVVIEGRGMVRAVCSSSLTKGECNNTRFRVERGDVVAIPRSHPMAQMSFNNDALKLMGFSLPMGGVRGATGPRFLAGKDSFLHALDKRVLEFALNVNGTTVSRLLASNKAESIKECISCAEEEERMMEEEEETESREEIPEEEEEEEEEESESREEDPEEEEEDDDEEGVWDRTRSLRGKEGVRRTTTMIYN